MGQDNIVFLDANAIIYSLDSGSEFFGRTVSIIQSLLSSGAVLCTSHHVIEEILFVSQKILPKPNGIKLVMDEVVKIPDLVLIEPPAKIEFAKRYAELADKYNLGVNDALILQLMIDSAINKLLSFDKVLTQKASRFGIVSIN